MQLIPSAFVYLIGLRLPVTMHPMILLWMTDHRLNLSWTNAGERSTPRPEGCPCSSRCRGDELCGGGGGPANGLHEAGDIICWGGSSSLCSHGGILLKGNGTDEGSGSEKRVSSFLRRRQEAHWEWVSSKLSLDATVWLA